MHVYLEIQKHYTYLGFLLSFSTTSYQPHLSACTGVPAQWDTLLSVMETAGVWYTQRPGWVTVTWTCRKMYLNSKWIRLVLLAQLAPLKWRGEDKTELILKRAQCSYLNCFRTWANEVSKCKYFYLLKQSILLGCYPRWTRLSWSRIKSLGYCLKFYRLQENISIITGRSCLNLAPLLLERPSPDVPKATTYVLWLSLTSKSFWEQMSSKVQAAESHFPHKENSMQEGITCSNLEFLAHLPYQKVVFCFLRHGYIKVVWVLGDPL